MSVGKKKFNYGQITTNLSTEMGAVAYNGYGYMSVPILKHKC